MAFLRGCFAAMLAIAALPTALAPPSPAVPSGGSLVDPSASVPVAMETTKPVDGFVKNYVNIATCEDSNGGSDSYL